MQRNHVSRNTSQLASGLLLSLLLGGCPSNGDLSATNFGNNLPPANGPGDVENFFPTTIGSSWNYFANVTNAPAGDPAFFMDEISVIGGYALNGQIATVFEESNPSGSGIPVRGNYLKNAGGLAFLGSSDINDTMTNAVAPYILALFPIAPGIVANFTKSGLDFNLDLDGDGIHESASVTVRNTINGFEAIALGIGKFERMLKGTEAINGNILLSSSKMSVPFSGVTTRWLAPGIGVLKQQQTITAGDGTQTVTSTTEMEARGYKLNNGTGSVAHGLGLPFQIASGLGNADSNLQNPGAPTVASDGNRFLVASARSDASAILAQLRDSWGALLGTITLGAGTAPAAVFDGTNYWLIYSSAPVSGPGCRAQRITATGILLDANPITLSSSANCTSPQRAVFGKSNGLVVYSRFNINTSKQDLYGVLVKLNGTVEVDEFPIVMDANDHLSPGVAFDGTNYMVVWEQHPNVFTLYSSIYVTHVTTAGAVVNPAGLAISTNTVGQYSPGIAFDGSNYLITWLDLRDQAGVVPVPHPSVYAARLRPDGLLLDGVESSSGFLLSAGAAQLLYSPTVAYTGSEYLVAWGSLDYASAGGQGVQAVRVGKDASLPAGTGKHVVVSGPPPAASNSRYVYPAIGTGNSAALLVWLDNAEVASTQKGVLGVSVAPF